MTEMTRYMVFCFHLRCLMMELSYMSYVLHVLMDLYYLSYMQGTEVVSAKLFISYMGTNTAKDFKVGQS